MYTVSSRYLIGVFVAFLLTSCVQLKRSDMAKAYPY